MRAKFIDFQVNEDDRGSLVVVEKGKHLPFLPKRFFYIYNVKDGKSRGNHANINSKFIMIPMKGQVDVLVDNGKTKKEFHLDDPHKGLYIPNLTWKSMYNFSDDCVLLVVANTVYDGSEYIKQYDDFIKYINEGK